MSSASRRAPLTESRTANSTGGRSISSSFKGGKASLSSNSTESMKAKSASRSSAPSSRSASAKHDKQRSRHRRAADDSDEESDEQADDGDSDQDFDDSRDLKSAKHKAAAKSKHQTKQQQQQQQAQQSALAASKAKAATTAQVAHRVAALARSHAVANAADGSLIMPQRNGRVGGGPAEAPAAISVDTTSFEEWMKMATDNKINSTNTWSFALIDYFHDMSLLRNESGDGSINFQKASCTLDGCVKVWTSRVDSVVVETGKLLSGLQDEINAENGKEKRSRGGEDGEDADDDDDDLDDDGENGGGAKSRKRTRNKEATLAKNFSQIQAKKFDLEFTVDPLFKKTSADFDEGGAGGLLMNHLGVDSNGRVVFDASDVAGVGDEGDTAEGLAADEDAAAPAADAEIELMDLTKLRAKLFEGEAAYGAGNSIASLIGPRVICPTLCNFSFSENDDTPFGVGLEDLDDAGIEMDVEGGGMAQSMAPFDGYQDDDNMMMQDHGEGADFFGGSAAAMPLGGADDEGALLGDDDDDAGVDFFDAPEADDGMAGGASGYDDGMAGGQGGEGGYTAFDPSAGPSQNDLVMALAFTGAEGRDAEDDNGADAGMFDYFDRRLMRNWAGPEHWKMSRVGAGPLTLGGINAKKGEEPTSKAAGTTRKSKEPFVIDFLSDEGAVNAKEIFEPAKQSSTIQLPATTRSKVSLANSNSDAYLLPEDRHFNSRQLLKLFLKPRFAINMRKRGGASRSNGIDEQFWAQAAAAHGGDAGLGGAGDDDMYNSAAMPFDTQFFHDNDDGFDPLSSELGGGDGSPSNAAANAGADLEDEEIQSLAALNRIKPEYVNYAKKAKRVDVKKLKENIWKELGIITEEQDGDATTVIKAGDEDDEQADGDTSTSTATATKPKQEYKTFDTVLSGLKKAYPKDKMEEISTSFCFICLLHLANEEGLQISTGGEDAAPRAKGGRGRKSATPTPAAFGQGVEPEDEAQSGGMAGLFEKLAAGEGGGRVVRSTDEDDEAGGEGWDDDDDDDDEEDAEDRIKVGKLESLRIVKDPKAFRSA